MISDEQINEYGLDNYTMETKLSRAQMNNVLRRWYYYDHNLGSLLDNDLMTAKSLYYRLSYLNDDDRAKLAYIYYYDSYKKFPSNKQIGKKYGLKSHLVSSFRNELMDNLRIPRLKPYGQEYAIEVKKRQAKIEQALHLVQTLVPYEYRD